jgi:hypothetical protein
VVKNRQKGITIVHFYKVTGKHLELSKHDLTLFVDGASKHVVG